MKGTAESPNSVNHQEKRESEGVLLEAGKPAKPREKKEGD